MGVARARDLANGRALSDETIGRMRSYFARHAVDSQAKGFFQGEPGFPTAGRIAWDLWGGDAGERWVNSPKLSEMCTSLVMRESEPIDRIVDFLRSQPPIGLSWPDGIAITTIPFDRSIRPRARWVQRHQYPIQEVRVADLVAIQQMVGRERVIKYLKNGWEEPILVEPSGGKFLIADGHHRAVAASLCGDETILAYVAPEQQSQEMRESDPLAALFVATSLRYPKAGDHVDGLTVRAHVPNLSSIDGYFADSKTLPGVRVVPMSDLGGPRTVFYAANDFARSERLADAIRASGEINPLIIGVDDKGAFIIEGAHRFVALYYLKVKEFPAVVVMGNE